MTARASGLARNAITAATSSGSIRRPSGCCAANAVSPGSTRTKILEESARLYEIEVEAFADQQPIKRLLEPEEVAAMIGFLASPGSRGATGGNYPVDGGLAV